MTDDLKIHLWNAIHRYTKSCGGDPDSRVYGNTPRQEAVVDVEAAVEAAIKAEVDKALADLKQSTAKRVEGLMHKLNEQGRMLSYQRQAAKTLSFQTGWDSGEVAVAAPLLQLDALAFNLYVRVHKLLGHNVAEYTTRAGFDRIPGRKQAWHVIAEEVLRPTVVDTPYLDQFAEALCIKVHGPSDHLDQKSPRGEAWRTIALVVRQKRQEQATGKREPGEE